MHSALYRVLNKRSFSLCGPSALSRGSQLSSQELCKLWNHGITLKITNIDREPHASHDLFSSKPHDRSSGRYHYCILGILLTGMLRLREWSMLPGLLICQTAEHRDSNPRRTLEPWAHNGYVASLIWCDLVRLPPPQPPPPLLCKVGTLRPGGPCLSLSY